MFRKFNRAIDSSEVWINRDYVLYIEEVFNQSDAGLMGVRIHMLGNFEVIVEDDLTIVISKLALNRSSRS